MKAYSLSYALELWRKTKEVKNVDPNFEKYLSLALRQFIIPILDPEASALKTKEFDAYCHQLTVDKLQDALELFDQQSSIAIEKGELTKGTRNNYYHPLKRFLIWMEKQVWWRELFPNLTDVAPFRAKLPPKLTQRKREEYGLKLEELPTYTQQKIEALRNFRLAGGKNLRRLRRRQKREDGGRRYCTPKIDAVKPSTFRNEEQAILRFLGWYSQAHSSEELHLELLTDVDLLDDYTYWVVNNRGVSHSTGVKMVETGIAIAKWLNFEKSTKRDWSDIPLILELQDLQSEYTEIYEQEKKQSDKKKWKLKELTHTEARQIVQYLYSLCAPNYGKHDPNTREFRSHGIRRDSAVARAWQTYLIVKILVYCPVRQEEIRNWKLGETLFRKVDSEDNPYYVVRLKEHKRSRSGKDRHYRLPSILTEDLDLWVHKWRPLIEDATKSSENWMRFWGYPPGKLERLQQRVESARRGEVSDEVQSSLDEYLAREEAKLQGAEHRLAGWEVAKATLESHNYLFFVSGKKNAESFGTPHYIASVWYMVSYAIATGSNALWGEPRWTNPHALRHIAEKHIRQLQKSDLLEPFGAFIGHSKEMGDEYAAQIMTENDLTKDIVDDWWVEGV